MNELIAKIDTYAPALAKELSISVAKLHDKLRWYVRVDSIQRMVFLVLLMISFGTFWAIAIPMDRKASQDNSYLDEEDYFFRAVFAFLVYAFIVALVLEEAINVTTNLIAPDFYIITKFLEMGGIK